MRYPERDPRHHYDENAGQKISKDEQFNVSVQRERDLETVELVSKISHACRLRLFYRDLEPTNECRIKRNEKYACSKSALFLRVASGVNKGLRGKDHFEEEINMFLKS